MPAAETTTCQQPRKLSTAPVSANSREGHCCLGIYGERGEDSGFDDRVIEGDGLESGPVGVVDDLEASNRPPALAAFVVLDQHAVAVFLGGLSVENSYKVEGWFHVSVSCINQELTAF